MSFACDDGGRTTAGFKGTTGDCGCRAVAIVMQRPYQEVYDDLIEFAKTERRAPRRRRRSHPRTGYYSATMRRYMVEREWDWQPTMQIGSGCKVHLRADELPVGRLLVRVSGHYTTMIDGVIHDTWNPSRNGTRCVYGYWYRYGS